MPQFSVYTLSFRRLLLSRLTKQLRKKFTIFFDFFVKLDVGVLFVKVVVKSINCVFVNVRTAVKSAVKAVSFVGKLRCALLHNFCEN